MKKVMLLISAALLMVACGTKQEKTENPMDTLLLQDYHPVNVNNIPETFVEKAKYPVIDMHSHDYAASAEEIDEWVENMDACNIEITNVMHCSWIGDDFETVLEKYSHHADRFRFWCCFDYTEIMQGGDCSSAIAYLEKCKELGAVGVGELGDKGDGDLYARPVEGRGIHLDDPRISDLLDKCGELRMPINIHVGEPYWMYLPLDSTNDGLPNGANWAIDTTKTDLGYWGLMQSFEKAISAHPGTIFIACHILNMTHDYPSLSRLMDEYPNLYLDMGARVAEIGQTPRAARDFFIRYQDRILYGTDNGMSQDMYRLFFRLLETNDEHFYTPSSGYLWHLSALDLPDTVLEKIYRTNALRIFNEYK